MPRRNLLLLLLVIVTSYVCFVQGAQNPYRRYLADGLTTIQHNSLEAVPSGELFASAMNGMVAELREHGDPYSQFYTATEAVGLRNEIHQQIGGIGIRVVLKSEPPEWHIAGPIDPDSPAEAAKLKVGDRIVKIDGRETVGMRLREVAEKLRGEPGTKVQLTVQSKDDRQPRDVELTRRLIEVESLSGDRRGPDGHWIFALEEDPRIAQVRITGFGDRTALEFESVMGVLKQQGVQGIVLDLRDNSGGALGSAVAVCEILLPVGKTIVETRGRQLAVRERYMSKADGIYKDLLLAVIVNQNSASASEIVAACLQDNHRGVVVGQRSFGKGTVQQMLPLGKSLLKLTWASFWRPSGANISRAAGASETAAWGVTPDSGYEEVLSSDEYKSFRSFRDQRDELAGDDSNSSAAVAGQVEFADRPLKAAVQYLQGELGEIP